MKEALTSDNLESPVLALTPTNTVLRPREAPSYYIATDHTETTNTSCFRTGPAVFMLRHQWLDLALAH